MGGLSCTTFIPLQSSNLLTQLVNGRKMLSRIPQKGYAAAYLYRVCRDAWEVPSAFRAEAVLHVSSRLAWARAADSTGVRRNCSHSRWVWSSARTVRMDARRTGVALPGIECGVSHPHCGHACI